MMKTLIVGGTFNHTDGKPSKIVSQLAENLNWPCINGGHLDELYLINFKELDVLIWMPNVDNIEDKILPMIKKANQRLLLIQSKRVVDNNYSVNDVIGRLLQSHSNLGIMITVDDQLFQFKLLDPLGNIWADTTNINDLAVSIQHRVDEITAMKRVRSQQVGDLHEFTIEPEFISIIQRYGAEFTQFVNAVNPNKLLGNASTRCARGFPGIRINDAIYVTRRNVDKQTLASDDFVQVESVENEVRYYGPNKPSVDTPIQIRLFNYYKNVNYMLHGHVYVKNGIMTSHKIPCGFIDEFDEIVKFMPDSSASNFIINLRGHGCLIMANNLEYFQNQVLEGRPFPEN